jgi:hypothetical protein
MSDIATTYAAQLPADIDSDVTPLTAEERENAGELTVSDLTGLDWDGSGVMLDGSDAESWSHDNTRKAGFAVHALQAYTDVAGGLASEPSEQVIRDLLGDLHHLTNALGLDFYGLSQRAADTYEDEANGRA